MHTMTFARFQIFLAVLTILLLVLAERQHFADTAGRGCVTEAHSSGDTLARVTCQRP